MGRDIPESEIDQVMQYGIYASREEARRSLENPDHKWVEMLIYEMKHIYGFRFMFEPRAELPVRNYVELTLATENPDWRALWILASTLISRKLSRLRRLFSKKFLTRRTQL
jgi:hypothetical protein